MKFGLMVNRSYFTHRMLFQHHETIGHLFVPGVAARIPSQDGAFYVKTNTHGFRSDWDFETQKFKKRILFLGDSHTAGDGCENSERFSDIIARNLDVETYNLGLSGSGTDQQFLIFQEYGLQYKADVIVWMIAVHNVERNKVGYREVVERSTGRRVLSPKPYFKLIAGRLHLKNVPVPKGYVPLESQSRNSYESNSPLDRLGWFRLIRHLREGRRYAVDQQVIGSEDIEKYRWLMLRLLRHFKFQPYPDFQNGHTYGWRLLKEIIVKLCRVAYPTPVIIVPLPVDYFYIGEIAPIYQPLFNRLSSIIPNVDVTDVTAPIMRFPLCQRKKLRLSDGHYSRFGHSCLADLMLENL